MTFAKVFLISFKAGLREPEQQISHRRPKSKFVFVNKKCQPSLRAFRFYFNPLKVEMMALREQMEAMVARVDDIHEKM